MTGQMLPSSPAGRIALLLDHSEVSRAELAGVLDLPDAITVDAALAGEYEFSPTDLVALADLLDVPVTVLTGQLPMEGHLGVSLRLGAVQAADVPGDALHYADMLLRYRSLLDSWLGAPENQLANVSMSTDRYYMRAGQVSAQRVRDALRRDEQPIADLVNLVEGLGFYVAFRPLPDGVHGLNVRDEREGTPNRIIIVSTKGPWTMQRYTLAHELCHALYDDAGQVIVDLVEVPNRFPELRAESFARHLVLPARALASEVNRARKAGVSLDMLTAQIMIHWGVSKTAVVKALEKDGLASAEDIDDVKHCTIDQLMARAHLTNQWREMSEGQSEPCGSPALVSRALEAYGNGWVGVHVVADLLGQDLESTERQLVAQGWTEPGTARIK